MKANNQKFLEADCSTKLSVDIGDFESGEAAKDYEKARSLGISVVIGRSDPSGFKVSPEEAEKLEIISNTAIRVWKEDRESGNVADPCV